MITKNTKKQNKIQIKKIGKRVSGNEYRCANMTLLDNNINRKIIFLEYISQFFDMVFVIGIDEGTKNKIKNTKMECIFFRNFMIMDTTFPPKLLFANNGDSKLFIIGDVSQASKSRSFSEILINGNTFNSSIVILDGDNKKIEKFKTIKLNINYIISPYILKSTLSKSHELYFTKYPTFESYSNTIKLLKNKIKSDNGYSMLKYILIVKSGRRYVSFEEKFKFVDLMFSYTCDIDFNDENEILNNLDENKLKLVIFI
jgi:hypothetical protein